MTAGNTHSVKLSSAVKRRYRDIRFGGASLHGRLRWIRIGWGHRYPLCCVLRWSFESKYDVQHRISPYGHDFVPCGLFHMAVPYQSRRWDDPWVGP